MRDEDPLVAGWREGTRQLVVDAVTSLPALILASLGVPATVVSGMAGESSPLPSALVAQALTGIAVVLWLHRLDATSRAVAMSADGPVDAAAAKDLPSVDYTDVILTFL